MDGPFPVDLRVCGIGLRFLPPDPVTLGDDLRPFLTHGTADPDETFQIRLLEQPLPLPRKPSHTQGSVVIYPADQGWLRVYPGMTAGDGCQVACLLRPNGENILYYPASLWHRFAHPLHCMHLIGAEVWLLRRQAFLLHSSVVIHNGKAVLFSGPSGSGKSTQADLWQTHLGAQVLNGDRCVARRQGEKFLAYGSPWAGTSGIYRNFSAPIAGVFLVTQAPENRAERLGFRALPALLSQTVVNSWDQEFMDEMATLFQDFLETIPVFRLYCRPDAQAVTLARDTLFPEEVM